MTSTDQALALGSATIVLEFLAWRFLRLERARTRLFVRSCLFLVLTAALWLARISPLEGAPWPADPQRHYLAQGLELLWWFQAAQLLASFATKFLLPESLRRERLLPDVLRALVFLAALLMSLTLVLELPVGGLIATSGALAIILGLAVQSTLSDVFSGVVLTATQPFRIGDIVTIGDVEGEVIDSDWRATTVLSGQGNLVVVPNSVAAKANIVNQSRPQRVHGIKIAIRLSSHARPSVVVEALQDAVAATSGVLEKPAATATAQAIHRNHVEYEILAYVGSLSKRAATRTEIIDRAHLHLMAHGIILGTTVDGSKDPSPKDRLLRGIEMFRTLSDEQFQQLSGKAVHENFAPGEPIYELRRDREHQKIALYIIESGVAVALGPHDGNEVELRRLSPGDAIGRAGFLTGFCGEMTVRALTRVAAIRLDKESLSPILQERPEIAKEMLESLLEYQAKAIRTLDELPTTASEPGGLVQRLLDSIRKLHGVSR